MNKSVQVLAHSNDLDIIVTIRRDLMQAFIDRETAAKEMGLPINTNRTKYTSVTETHQSVKKFIYLGFYKLYEH